MKTTMITTAIALLLTPVSTHAGIITWTFGGDDWHGTATFHGGPPDFVSPGTGSLHRYVQRPDQGQTIEIVFGDFTLRESAQWRVQTLDRIDANESRIALDAFESWTQIYYQGQLADEGYHAWGVRLNTTGRIWEPLSLPETISGFDEIIEAGVSVAWDAWELDGLPTPERWHEMTYIGGAEIPSERWVRPPSSKIPEPSAFALTGLAAVWFAWTWRRRKKKPAPRGS